MAPITTSALLFAAAALLAPATVSATLTKFDTEFDGKAVFLASSLRTIGDVAAAQNDAWLLKLFTDAKTKVDAGLTDGTMTVAEYVKIVNAFYDAADTKYKNFASVASSNVSGGEVDMASFEVDVGGSWCDFIFDTFRSLATEGGKADAIALVEAETKTFEGFVTTKKDKTAIDDAFIVFINKLNGLDDTIIDKFDDKVTALAATITKEKNSVATTKETETVTTTAPPTSLPTTDAPTATDGSTEGSTVADAANANATDSTASSEVKAPTPAPTTVAPTSGASQLVSSVATVMTVVVAALALSVW